MTAALHHRNTSVTAGLAATPIPHSQRPSEKRSHAQNSSGECRDASSVQNGG